MSGAEPLAAPWPLAHPGALCPGLRLRLCLRLPQPPELPSPGMRALLLSPSRPWTWDFRSGLRCSHRGGCWRLPRLRPSGSHGRHFRSWSELRAPATAGGLRPRGGWRGTGRLQPEGCPETLARAGGPARGGHFWALSLPAPVIASKSHPTLRGGQPREGSAGLTCSPGDRGISPRSSAPAGCPLPPRPCRASPL